jgi:UDP-glucose 6-dehydrogenase
MTNFRVVVDKSTLPVEATDSVKIAIVDELKNVNLQIEYLVDSGPEL